MPRAGQRALGVAGVELGGEADVADDLLGDPEVGQERAAHALQRRQLQQQRADALGQRVGQALVDADHHLRRVGRPGEGVEHLARALRLGRHQVEGLAVEAGLVGDVVHRRGHVVDGHDVREAELQADEREPLGQRVARLLDRLEEVVGPVDLVHLAGLRVADDDGRAGRCATGRSTPRARSSRSRTSSGGRTRAASGPRRTCPRGRGPCTGRRRRPTRRGAGCRPRARWPAPPRCACRSRWRGRWPRCRPSCRRRPRGGRSGRSCRGARRSRPASTPRRSCVRSPTTAVTRSPPSQPSMSSSSRSFELSRTST